MFCPKCGKELQNNVCECGYDVSLIINQQKKPSVDVLVFDKYKKLIGIIIAFMYGLSTIFPYIKLGALDVALIKGDGIIIAAAAVITIICMILDKKLITLICSLLSASLGI